MDIASDVVQKEFTDIWDSLATNAPRPGAVRKIDYKNEQILVAEFDGIGLVTVYRKPGEPWKFMPTVGRENTFFEFIE